MIHETETRDFFVVRKIILTKLIRALAGKLKKEKISRSYFVSIKKILNPVLFRYF
jgi:hypothetical protein